MRHLLLASRPRPPFRAKLRPSLAYVHPDSNFDRRATRAAAAPASTLLPSHAARSCVRPHSAVCHAGFCAQRRRQLRRARAHVLRAARSHNRGPPPLPPKHPSPPHMRGCCSWERGLWDEARSRLSRRVCGVGARDPLYRSARRVARDNDNGAVACSTREQVTKATVVWAMDRLTFRSMLYDNTKKKRDMCAAALCHTVSHCAVPPLVFCSRAVLGVPRRTARRSSPPHAACSQVHPLPAFRAGASRQPPHPGPLGAPGSGAWLGPRA